MYGTEAKLYGWFKAGEVEEVSRMLILLQSTKVLDADGRGDAKELSTQHYFFWRCDDYFEIRYVTRDGM